MTMRWQYGLAMALCLALAVGLGLALAQDRFAVGGGAKADAAAAGPRFSVVATEGHNLIVTDNKTNVLYFYTIDKGEEVGSDLKLRGSVDLNDVGKAVLRPTKAKAKPAP
jgi:hypothetical protein